jgi:hypothetical protein
MHLPPPPRNPYLRECSQTIRLKDKLPTGTFSVFIGSETFSFSIELYVPDRLALVKKLEKYPEAYFCYEQETVKSQKTC